LIRKKCVDLQNHHCRGGQSQNRIQRLADESHFNYISAVIELMRKYYVQEDGTPSIEGLVIMDPAQKKDDLYDRLGPSLGPNLQKAVRGIVTISGTESVRELHRMAIELVNKEVIIQETAAVSTIYEMIADGRDSLLVFGEDEIKKGMVDCTIKRLIVHINVVNALGRLDHLQTVADVQLLRYTSDSSERFLREFSGMVGIKYFAD
jgi:peptide subunit release factor 1 (eRF1)